MSWATPTPAERDQRTHDALHARRLAAESGDNTTAWLPSPVEWNATLRENLTDTAPPVPQPSTAAKRKRDAATGGRRMVHDGYVYRWQYVEVPTTDLTE